MSWETTYMLMRQNSYTFLCVGVLLAECGLFYWAFTLKQCAKKEARLVEQALGKVRKITND